MTLTLRRGVRVVTHDGKVLKNVYVSGRAATGAKGVLASTMMKAYVVAAMILGGALPGRNRWRYHWKCWCRRK
jgi:hypothetical protein